MFGKSKKELLREKKELENKVNRLEKENKEIKESVEKDLRSSFNLKQEIKTTGISITLRNNKKYYLEEEDHLNDASYLTDRGGFIKIEDNKLVHKSEIKEITFEHHTEEKFEKIKDSDRLVISENGISFSPVCFDFEVF